MTLATASQRTAAAVPGSGTRAAAGARGSRSTDVATALALFFAAACAYLVGYSGRFKSTDELEMFTTAWSLAVHRTLAIDQLRWALKTPGTGFDLYGADGRLYSYIEPLHSLLALPLVWLARWLPDAGNIEVALLLNVGVTALIAPVVYAWLRRLAFSPLVAALTALSLAFGTLLWPYSKTFFREPLAALTLAGLFLAWTIARQSNHPVAGLATGALLGLHAGARLSNLVTSIGLAAGTLWRGQRVPWRAVGFAAGGLALTLLLVAGLELARYGGRFHALQVQSGLPAAPLYVGLYGLLLSPGKGFFWYSPVALLALFGLRGAYRRCPAETAAIGVTAGLWLVVLAGYYDWWGGLGWGPRFMAGLVPLLALPLAVVFERAFERSRREDAAPPGERGAASRQPIAPGSFSHRLLRTGTLAILASSVLVQVFAVAGDYGAYLAELVERFGTTTPETTVLMASPLLSPVLGQVGLVLGGRLDLALVGTAAGQPTHWLPLVLGVAGALSFSGVALRLAGRGRRRAADGAGATPTASGRLTALSAAIAVAGVVAALWLSAAVVTAAAERRAGDGVAAAPASIARRAEPGDVAVTLLEHETHRYLNADKSAVPTVGLALAPVTPGSRTEQALIELMGRPRTLWLVMQGVDRADGRNGVERWLAERAFRGEQDWQRGVRTVPFRTTPIASPAPALPSVPARVGPAQLTGVTASKSAPAGGEITVETRWAPVATPAQRLRIFVNVVGLDGQGLVTSIAEPLDGFLPTTDWQPGQTIADRRLLQVPPAARPAVYRIEVGLFDPAADRRLPVDGQAGATAVVAAFVAIRPGEPITVQPGARPSGATFELSAGAPAVRLAASSLPASIRAGGPLGVDLYWQSVAPVGEDLAVFIHALGPNGRPAFQQDATAGGRFPTGVWEPPETVADRVALSVPADAAGAYEVVAGLYRRSTGERLRLATGEDTVRLGTVEVRP